MEEIELRLNNFLFNSGILGFYRILQKNRKLDAVILEGNCLKVKSEILEHFEEDYFNAMISSFEKDTKWYAIVNMKESIETMSMEGKEEKKIFEEKVKFIKQALESASYKAGYEILKSKGIEENPYEYLNIVKKEKDSTIRRENVLKIIKHINKYKEIYCMKNIIYNKINMFWENVAFLNRQANKNDMKEEYKKVFVKPALNYIQKQQKSEYNCIECGNKISKSDASGMSWLKDVGVDINRKKSAFWNFKEDTFLCPICNLIYSCIPLGFYIINSNAIFINNNEEIEMLIRINNEIRIDRETEKEKMENTYQKVFYYMLQYVAQEDQMVIAENEPKNIQVVKRIASNRDNMKYEFNIISKDKLEKFNKTKQNFKNLLNIYVKDKNDNYINVYEQVLNNFLENKKQYALINCLINTAITENNSIDYIYHILKIQFVCIGGIDLDEIQAEIGMMQKAGRQLKEYFGESREDNKLRSYVFQLNNALRVNNVNLFMELITRMYCGIGRDIPNSYGFAKMLGDSDKFKILGYAYILGIKQEPKKQKEDKEVEKNEGGN